jgi:hypothetical protein
VVHWDLPPNAADLEQREGRIQRFAGLAVRREIATRLRGARLAGPPASSATGTGGCWHEVHRLATQQFSDESGLAPWWVFEGADIERIVFDMPTSEQRGRLEQLHVQRGLYRMVLGQPHQEDLMAVLRQRQLEGQDLPADIAPMLSPYFRDVGP